MFWRNMSFQTNIYCKYHNTDWTLIEFIFLVFWRNMTFQTNVYCKFYITDWAITSFYILYQLVLNCPWNKGATCLKPTLTIFRCFSFEVQVKKSGSSVQTEKVKLQENSELNAVSKICECWTDSRVQIVLSTKVEVLWVQSSEFTQN